MPPLSPTFSKHLRDRFGSGVGRDAFWQLIGLCLRLLCQSLSFLLIARSLGPTGFGMFVAAVALVSTLSPFVDLGTYGLVIRDTAAGVPSQRTVGASIAVTALLSPLALTIAVILGPYIFPAVSTSVFACIGLAGFLGMKGYNLCRAWLIANNRMRGSAILEAVGGAIQVLAAALLYSNCGGVDQGALLYCGAWLLFGVTALIFLIAHVGIPIIKWSDVTSRVRSGIHFSVGGATTTLQSELDKALLGRLAHFDATGVYAAAHRVSAMALLPASALLSALYPRLCVAGRNGLRAARDEALRFAPVVAGYGGLVAAAGSLMAGFLPLVLGPEYEASVNAFRIIVWTVPIQGVGLLLSDALTGADRQEIRTRSQIISMTFGALLNIAFIPTLGWRAAALSALASSILYLALVLRPLFSPAPLPDVRAS